MPRSPGAPDIPPERVGIDPFWNQMRLTDKGAPRPIAWNGDLLLSQHEMFVGAFAFDKFTNRTMVRRSLPWDQATQFLPRPIEERDDYETMLWLQSEYQLNLAQPAVHDIINGVAHRTAFHQVTDYLRELVWDSQPRIGNSSKPLDDHTGVGWLTYYCGVADSIFVRALSARMLISAVARVFNPGCQVDTVLILIGPTGLGKSSVFQILGAPWYSNTIAALSSEAAREQTQGTWIHELAELDAVHRAEWSAILNFISTREDKFRMKFQRRSAIYKRQCVFVGSTEQEDWLRDLSGHRRWWPVRCFSIDLEALAEAKAQLWAEALVRYFAQERWYLFEPELIGDARAAVEAVITVDEWESYILPFVAARPFVLVTDICNECLQIPRERQTLPTFLRIARILSPLGWQRKAIRILDDRGKSHLSKVWVNPKNLDEY